ncbi:hypothetical protein EYF80_013167 [Liparis tanakae]|uniref:Uncharacterized protein n=1 Tax=Liparis tanakae TaxID=230148 RepID=A0A4Z2IGD0_9TELE|nr:hypothetical protein EYF80_013167 [Liparis tanakae]
MLHLFRERTGRTDGQPEEFRGTTVAQTKSSTSKSPLGMPSLRLTSVLLRSLSKLGNMSNSKSPHDLRERQEETIQDFLSHLEPLWLVELDGGLALDEALIERAALHPPLLFEHFLLAVDAAHDVDVPAVLQVLGAQARQVGQLEQGLVVGGCVGVGPLQVEGFLFPVLAEELLRPHGLDEALEQADRAVEAQGGLGLHVLYLALFGRELLVATAPSLCADEPRLMLVGGSAPPFIRMSTTWLQI